MDFWSIAVMLAVGVVLLELFALLQRGVGHYRGYFALLCIDGALLAATLREERFAEGGGPWPELVGGVLLCVLIVFVPRLLGYFMRRALSRERMVTAARLATMREYLQPGAAATSEREMLADLAAVQAGALDAVLRRLRERMTDADPGEEGAIHERIITLYGFGRRFREAATHFETHLHRFDPGRQPGIAIQMVRAYGELGDLERAADVVRKVELSARAREAGGLAALGQARLLLLAFVGRRPEVERLLKLDANAQTIPPRLRALLVEIGDEAATEPPGEEVQRYAQEVDERVAAELRAVRDAPLAPRPRATLILIALNLAAFAVVHLRGEFATGSDLVRAGASFHVAVRGGEWFRLWTAMFLHGGGNLAQGLLHLGLNMYGLYLLGRLVEPLYGWRRFVIVYCVAGLAGNLLSALNPRPEAVLSVGASGAVLGLLGALLVSLLPRQSAWPEGARRPMLWNLAILVVVQLGMGAVFRVVDNFAHVGGLLGGCAIAALLLPSGLLGPGRIGTAIVSALLALLGGTALWSVDTLARTSVDMTMEHLPLRAEIASQVRVQVAAHVLRESPTVPEWPGQILLVDPVLDLAWAPHAVEAPGATEEEALQAVLDTCRERDRRAILALAHDRPDAAPALSDLGADQLEPFPGWRGTGLLAEGAEARRMLYYARLAGPGRALVIEVTRPETRPLSPGERAAVARLLASAELDATAAGAPPQDH